jgi:hypothetical protein
MTQSGHDRLGHDRSRVMTQIYFWVMTRIGHDPSSGQWPGSLTHNTIVLNEQFKNRKTERAVEHSPFLKKIATYQSVSEWVSEKAKLIRGGPPKIDFKKKGEPPKNKHFIYKKARK